ncbi:MAG TPA: hypothetical protein VFI49_10395 [Rudaea sp.]|nr:hypothetical protein [Rudaea sp.]
MMRTLTIAIATALGAMTSSASAVMLNPRGTGQVLIYPYYTVNHQQTLLSVINTTAHGKALKVRFREGYDGRDVANFNVYLGPYDSWVGAVFDTGSDGTGAAAIATNDKSCTVPAFPLAPVPGTLHALTFSNANYSQGDYGAPTGTDSGPTNLARTREGFFEIIEMGEVIDQQAGSPKTLEAITVTNQPPGCAQVMSAWSSGGYWAANATTDLSPPAGGLYGSAGIVDVAQGTLYAYNATAIDGFSDTVQHTGPQDPKPNLSTAATDSAHDIATAYVSIGNAMIKADYPASTRGVDAVSAVLMAQQLANEFNSDPVLGAQTDFLVTYPTKQFYVDPGIVGTQSSAFIAPFEQVFGGGGTGSGEGAGKSCIDARADFFDRVGRGIYTGSPCGLPPIGSTNELCLQTEAIPLGAHAAAPGALQSNLRGQLLQNDQCGGPLLAVTYDTGNVRVGFTDQVEPDYMGPPYPVEELRASVNGKIFLGVPAVGFVAINYINANVTPGVLSNYSGTYPHRSWLACFAMAGGPCE